MNIYDYFSAGQRSGLPSKFEQFRQNIEISEGQREKIKSSHTHLRQNVLQSLFYIEKTFLTGSYKKRTIIRPPNDVDLFVVIDANVNDIAPYSILNRLKKDLNSSYPNSKIKQDKPCIILDFNHCKFELTPVVEYDSYFNKNYYIPNQSSNQWIPVKDPKILEQSLANANSRLSGKLTPLIKMMKKCKRHNNLKNKSFEMEEIAISNLFRIDSYRNGVEDLLSIYNWVDDIYSIKRMTDDDFAYYCRNTLFGPDFPQ